MMVPFLLFLLALPTFALEKELSGNIEAQGRHAWNNPEAKEDLFQRWNQKDFYLIYGNLNGKLEFDDSRIEANWFVRHSYSELYHNNFLATQIYTFPNKLVARDFFKLQYKKQENNYNTESILNKFYYEWTKGEHRFMVGRMYINYGQGEIFNPINPFNQPTGLTSISQVAQGNDGLLYTYYIRDGHSLDFYVLGDRSFDNYTGKVNGTFWLHGELNATSELQLDYVLGRDQNRNKVGGQASYRFEEAMVFVQTLYQSEYIDDRPSDHLWDAMLGFDQQFTSKWHVRLESGYQKTNRFATLNNFGERFLPTEYFVAISNQYEIHPLIKLNGTVINDIKSGFTYLIGKSTFDLGNDTEADIFAYVPAAKGSKVGNVAQKLVTTDVGLALRKFF